jgi:hypothetical protein
MIQQDIRCGQLWIELSPSEGIECCSADLKVLMIAAFGGFEGALSRPHHHFAGQP